MTGPEAPALIFSQPASSLTPRSNFYKHRSGDSMSQHRGRQPASSVASCILYFVSDSWDIRRQHNMKTVFCFGALVLFALPTFAACPQQPKDASVLVQLEQTWAPALEAHDADA